MTEAALTPLDVVRAYHRGWSSGRFDEAIARLSPDLAVEVPINAYGSAAEFGAAVRAFGALAERVVVLCELAHDDEVMLLYDMDVRGLGALRVAEHFTVRDQRIARIRQIHDTATLRAAGFARGS